MNIVLSPAAQTDLEDIWLYSAEQWGRQQANNYLAKLRAAIAKVQSGRGSRVATSGLDTGV